MIIYFQRFARKFTNLIGPMHELNVEIEYVTSMSKSASNTWVVKDKIWICVQINALHKMGTTVKKAVVGGQLKLVPECRIKGRCSHCKTISWLTTVFDFTCAATAHNSFSKLTVSSVFWRFHIYFDLRRTNHIFRAFSTLKYQLKLIWWNVDTFCFKINYKVANCYFCW